MKTIDARVTFGGSDAKRLGDFLGAERTKSSLITAVNLSPDLILQLSTAPDCLGATIEKNEMVLTGSRTPAEASRGYDEFGYHADGVFKRSRPRWVVLACLHPGTADVRTKFADPNVALSSLCNADQEMLRAAQVVYVHRDGRKSTRALIESGESSSLRLNLAAGGYLAPSTSPAARVIDFSALARAYVRFLDAIAAAAITEVAWSSGLLVQFDNDALVRARAWTGDTKTADPARSLFQVWLSDGATKAHP